MTENAETGWTGGHNPWVIALVVTLATFMEVLDTSIANVSLPHIAAAMIPFLWLARGGTGAAAARPATAHP